ncbi:DUF1634 domain-containing protein [Burkholderia pseudomultivorans]|uniref:DUF1634 domain-containing protein n=1 Tax=Burkholderia pseudomultivorans TaxID=1207504 RepID=A0ABU2E9I1_9BURK|nr:DUF1634 domain-containing protein [Burkholderia pseudomultivorans]MDR8726319.1 hypothetical protein [Burkholderia pseudomultivorans]MDR8733543.1 hypothetical protein [Burkholderia pseudomultivorans]MDR8740069.1 hypothetical protein [Burkholderia pseudomultivorans]MDR8756168.1 hypothetical protein [Burkholderia pseudomultivorans]MDR8776658.1 hypothetical protein [Burkholderia pseudomultivorans]
MTRAADGVERRERAVAALLRGGTVCACVLIAVGMLLGAWQPAAGASEFARSGAAFAKAGVGLFILLPVARVVLLLGWFVRERDRTYALLSLLVLVIIAAGMVVGMRG